MFRSSLWLLLLLPLVGHAQENSELSFFYKSFEPNAGGQLMPGARYRHERFEVIAMVDGALKAGAGYFQPFDTHSSWQPHLMVGAYVIGGIGPYIGAGMSYSMFHIFSGELGLGFDNYVPMYFSHGHSETLPQYLLFLAYLF